MAGVIMFSGWSYRRMLRDGRLRALFAGDVVAKVGDGMIITALPLLTLRVHGDVPAALAIGAVQASPYVLATVLAFTIGLGTLRIPPRALILADCLLRGGALVLVGVLAVADSVTLVTLAGGLLAGSVFRIVAMSARRLVFTAMVEPEARFTANALLGTSTSLALYAVGPVLGGVLSTAASPGTAVLVNGLSLVVLAVAVAFAAPAKAGAVSGASVSVSGFQVLRRIPVAARLLVVVFGFNLFYMPVEVALPLLVRGLDGSGVALGLVWSGFGAGALLGAVLANRLQRFSGQKVLVAIIGGWAATVLLLLAAPSTPFAVAVFFVGGLVYAPFTPVVYTLVQSALEPAEQQPLITLWTAGSALAAPIGLALAGPLVHGMGPEGALLVSASLTVALVPFAGAGLRTTRFRARA